MSHFTVLVIGDDLEGQLAPYDENLSVKPYKVPADQGTVERFISCYGNPVPRQDYEIACVANAKELGLYPVTTANVSRAWPVLAEAWQGEKGGWDESGAFTWSTSNPQAKWDYWRIGGRWGGHWKLKPGRKGNTAAIAWEMTFDDPGRQIPPDRCDQARKGDIDFEGLEAEAAATAAAQWTLWEPILKQLPAAAPWQEFLERVKAKTMGAEAARTAYNNQPQVKALHKAFPTAWGIAPGDFGDDREEYIRSQAHASWVPYAVVQQGRWVAKGEMGWFGMGTGRPQDEKAWVAEVRSVVLTLPDDAPLTIVDCHI